eukprot:CAMPEP_0197836682 /NCGR_PEP_ID=MMETSP1437-20131217/29713_1 /TAXON_ID=49252 ORGANISM="Eucampia antarctica, Strain CCMP1452" /NCGR_SAMPLE_ID=MMETSP1437 /ASSEMBLY_ACC=CAM_ASM_001096 /LENGTH=337 /DNA_ID=CAMNT_0043443055 /DNA_START=135 /DNA_END=1148 /DNA_ORIENTATION=-
MLLDLPFELTRLEVSVQTPTMDSPAVAPRIIFTSPSSSKTKIFCGTSCDKNDIVMESSNHNNNRGEGSINNSDDADDENPRRMLDGIEDGSTIDIHRNTLGPNMTWPIQNNLFEGNICLLLRDHPRCDYNFDGEDDIFFEVQIQGKFKRQPQGPLYLSLEFPQVEKYKVSWPIKTALNALVSFIKSWGYKYLHLSYGGNGETPHLSTPAFQALDRLVITEEGQQPPPLGHPIPESYDETIIRKKFQFQHLIDTSFTYTMSFNNSFVNPVDWKVYGVPFVKSVDLSFTDTLRLCIHEVVEENEQPLQSLTQGNIQSMAQGRHTKRNIAMWIQLHKKSK